MVSLFGEDQLITALHADILKCAVLGEQVSELIRSGKDGGSSNDARVADVGIRRHATRRHQCVRERRVRGDGVEPRASHRTENSDVDRRGNLNFRPSDVPADFAEHEIAELTPEHTL